MCLFIDCSSIDAALPTPAGRPSSVPPSGCGLIQLPVGAGGLLETMLSRQQPAGLLELVKQQVCLPPPAPDLVQAVHDLAEGRRGRVQGGFKGVKAAGEGHSYREYLIQGSAADGAFQQQQLQPPSFSNRQN